MAAMKIHYFAVGFLLFIFLLATGLAVALNTDFGSLDAKIIVIPNGDHPISGLLYLPRHADSANPSPGIVLVHGISSAKQSMSGIAIELARRGFVVLAIDAVGHGGSGGQLTGTQDPTLGALAAVRYLESQSFVNALSIGLVGHSLGAGAIRATAVAHGNIGASVYIGGGLGSMVSGSAYGVFNSTFPKNLLFAVGKYDVLFDLTQLRNEALLPIFGVTEEVSPGRLYGDFSTQTARKLITPVTTHLFEPSDPYCVSETVSWMTIALQPRSVDQNSSLENNLTYLYREAAMIVSLIAFIGLILPVSLIITSLSAFRSGKEKSKAKYGVLESWKTLVVWGGLSIILFLPMSFIGFLIPFPPVIFGASLAWWVLMVALAGLLLIFFLGPRFSTVRLKPKKAILDSFDRANIVVAVALFTLAYIIAGLVEVATAIDLGIIVPFFRILNPPQRILLFVSFIPFFLVYFFVEGLYLHEFQKWPVENSGFHSELVAAFKVIGVKIIPYVALLLLQYSTLALFSFKLLSGFTGLLIEFLWLIVPVFTISTACSWWFYRNTSTIGLGVIFNSLLFAWISAGLFPF